MEIFAGLFKESSMLPKPNIKSLHWNVVQIYPASQHWEFTKRTLQLIHIQMIWETYTLHLNKINTFHLVYFKIRISSL